MENNMTLWNNLREVPATAQKKITGGRLSGMTDIKPQWRYERLTEILGPYGVGWKFDIVQKWLEEGADGVVVANVQVAFFYRLDYSDDTVDWSDPIPGLGGSMFVAKEKAGPYTSDEAYKMALTDALGTAAKMLGLAADVYMGNAAGSSKYSGKQLPKEKTSAKQPDESPLDEKDKITPDQIKKLSTMITTASLDRIKFKLLFKVSSMKDLEKNVANWIFKHWDTADETLKKPSVLDAYQEKFGNG